MRQFIKKIDNTIIELGVQPITYDVLEKVIVEQCSAEDIQEIHIENAAFGDEGALFLANVVKGNKQLEILHINTQHNYLSQTDNRIAGQGMRVLALALRMNKNVHTLNLSQNNLGDVGAKHVAYMLQNCGIKHLNLDYNDIKADGVEKIADSLRDNRTLESLSLVDNLAKDKGAQALARMIEHNKKVKHLNLTNNDIREAGAEHLASCIQSNRTIETLILTKNKIGLDGLEAIAAALETNESLKSVDVSMNGIGLQQGDDPIEKTARALAQGIRANQHLVSLNLSGNHFNLAGQALIDEAKRANPRLAASVSTATSAVARMATHATASSSAATSTASTVKKTNPLRM